MPRTPPFAGLRRNVVPIAAGLAILVAIWLVPDLTPPSSVPTPVRLVHELYEADQRVNRSTLFWRAMNVGRSRISATVNTLHWRTSARRCR